MRSGTRRFGQKIVAVHYRVPMLAYVAEARRPPTFVAFKPAGGPSSYAPTTRARLRASYWQEGEARTPLTEPVNAVGELEAVVAPASGQAKEWPVVVLDESLRLSVTYPMSASRFLLELATRPERVALPPHIDQRR